MVAFELALRSGVDVVVIAADVVQADAFVLLRNVGPVQVLPLVLELPNLGPNL